MIDLRNRSDTELDAYSMKCKIGIRKSQKIEVMKWRIYVRSYENMINEDAKKVGVSMTKINEDSLKISSKKLINLFFGETSGVRNSDIFYKNLPIEDQFKANNKTSKYE